MGGKGRKCRGTYKVESMGMYWVCADQGFGGRASSGPHGSDGLSGSSTIIKKY